MRNGTRGWRAVPNRCLDCCSLVSSSLRVVASRIRRIPIAYRPPGFHPVEAVILGAYIPRRFPQLISSALGSSSHTVPRLAVPSGRADKQTAGGRQCGRAGRRAALALGPVLVFPPPYRPRPRLVHRVVGRGEGVSLPSAGSVSGPRFPVPVAGQGIVVGSTPQPSRQASRQGRAARPRSVPRIGRREAIGQRPSYRQTGRSSWPHQSARRASKQDGGDPRPVRPPRPRLGPSCRLRGSSSVKQSIDGNGK